MLIFTPILILTSSQRTKLSSKNLTKITLETFNAWKAKKIKEKKKKQQEEMKKKKDDVKLGKSLGVSSWLCASLDICDVIKQNQSEVGNIYFEI